VQVNTVSRTPAESFAEPVPREQKGDYFSTKRDGILTLLKRRPCSVEDIAAGLGLHRNEVVKYLEQLNSECKIVVKLLKNQLYYSK
jgi:predicted ArsR family transcriptional regulator